MNKIEVKNSAVGKQVKLGQIYQYEGEVYIVSGIVVCGETKYFLVNLSKGNTFTSSKACLDHIFEGYKNQFTLITGEIKITPGY